MASHIPIGADMRRKLETAADINRSPIVTAEGRRADAEIQLHREIAMGQDEARSESADESIIVMAANPAERQVQARAQFNAGAQFPPPGQVGVAKDFRLVKAIGLAVFGKTVAGAGRFQGDFGGGTRPAAPV